jgi:hypothetical protein
MQKNEVSGMIINLSFILSVLYKMKHLKGNRHLIGSRFEESVPGFLN